MRRFVWIAPLIIVTLLAGCGMPAQVGGVGDTVVPSIEHPTAFVVPTATLVPTGVPATPTLAPTTTLAPQPTETATQPAETAVQPTETAVQPTVESQNMIVIDS